MTKTFTTRSGNRFTIQVLADIGHALEGLVIKGRFKGRVMIFPKHDMAEV